MKSSHHQMINRRNGINRIEIGRSTVTYTAETCDTFSLQLTNRKTSPWFACYGRRSVGRTVGGRLLLFFVFEKKEKDCACKCDSGLVLDCLAFGLA